MKITPHWSAIRCRAYGPVLLSARVPSEHDTRRDFLSEFCDDEYLETLLSLCSYDSVQDDLPASAVEVQLPVEFKDPQLKAVLQRIQDMAVSRDLPPEVPIPPPFVPPALEDED